LSRGECAHWLNSIPTAHLPLDKTLCLTCMICLQLQKLVFPHVKLYSRQTEACMNPKQHMRGDRLMTCGYHICQQVMPGLCLQVQAFPLLHRHPNVSTHLVLQLLLHQPCRHPTPVAASHSTHRAAAEFLDSQTDYNTVHHKTALKGHLTCSTCT